MGSKNRLTMGVTRRKFSASFKAKVAMDAMREQQTLAELAKKYDLSPTQISLWKHEAIKNMDKIFGGRSEKETIDKDAQIQRLQSKVGQLVLERDFLEDACKKVGLK